VWTLIGTRNYVYIAVVGGLLLFWSCFRAWDEQRESAESVAPEGMRVTIKNLESQLQDLRNRIPRMRILTAGQRERFKKALGGQQVHLSGGLVCRAGDSEAENYTNQLIWMFRNSSVLGGEVANRDGSFNLKGLEIVANDIGALSAHCRLLMKAFDASGVGYKLIQNPTVNVQTARASGGAHLDLFFVRVGENEAAL
jgi:hypothetical protein